MNDNDKIYELFRQHEHKLDEKPSRRAWERLDARLDKHDARGSTSAWFRYGGMVAAILILVVTATMLTLNTQMENEQFASLEKSDVMESSLLDFETVGNNDSYLRIVAYQKEYKNRGSRITEQTMAGNLKPRGTKKGKKTETIMMLGEADEAIAANDIIEETAEEMLLEDAEYVDFDDKMVKQNMTAVEKLTTLEGKEEEVMEEPELAEMEAKKMIAEADIPAKSTVSAIASAMPEPTAPSAAVGNANYKEDMKGDVRSAKSKDFAIADGVVDFGINEEDDSHTGMDVKEDLYLTSFEWMLGSWEGNVNGSESTEKWTKIDASTYKGKGILKAGGTTLFSEKLELKKMIIGTYLTVSLDKKNKRVAYLMTSNEGGTIVFENRSISYPQKIVMKKNSNNSFSMTMQNGDTGSLDSKQVQYLETRNNIVGEKLIRSLKKSE
ncbi:MAG: hypothetical protein ACI94Y_003079 [Maribacter sp.]|jgi:hypothetical protein